MMTNDRRVLIGLGCSTAATGQEIIALVEACLLETRAGADQIVALASHARKTGSRALAQAALYFGAPLFFLADEALDPAISSTCEAVASLAGPLRLPKRKSRFATCAIAACAPAFTLDRLAQSSASAATVSSMLATSVALP
jgi:cobalt-precorrin 5A hydrolase/precorrin-3B C17-methyltransferase